MKLGKIKKNQYLVGFALETDDHIDNAKVKLKSKNLDAIIVNKIGDFNPISSDYNQIDFINSNLEVTSFKKKLKIKNFGSFSVKFKKSRVGRNPKKKEKEFIISARNVIRFQVSESLKRLMNNNIK